MIRNKGDNFKTITSSVILGAIADGDMMNSKPFLKSEMVNYLLGINEDMYTVALHSSHFEGGSLSGFGYYLPGEMVEVTATPNPSWEFLSWTNNLGMVLSHDETYSFTMPEAHQELHANFRLITAVEENASLLKASLYPNPAQDHIVLTTQAGLSGKAFRVLDQTGRTVMTALVGAERITIPIGHLPSGVYVLLFEGQNVMPQRFIKR